MGKTKKRLCLTSTHTPLCVAAQLCVVAVQAVVAGRQQVRPRSAERKAQMQWCGAALQHHQLAEHKHSSKHTSITHTRKDNFPNSRGADTHTTL